MAEIEDSKELTWFEIVFEVDPDQAETVSVLLAEAGCAGSESRELAGARAAVVVFTHSESLDAAREAAARLRADLPPQWVKDCSVAALDEALWTENWRRHFPPLAIGRRIEVIPPWEPPGCTREGQAGLLTIVINPAMAFGTGHHQTTAACLELIEKLLRPGDLVADIGCGSGILSIAAAKLGAARVLAVDTDEEAVNATRENAVTNRVGDLVDTQIETGAPGETTVYETGSFDLVVANILAETLVELRNSLTSCVKEGGHIILSGIEHQRLPLVEKAFIDSTWRPLRRRTLGEWSTIALHRQSAQSPDRTRSAT